jgi:hypothetical protein
MSHKAILSAGSQISFGFPPQFFFRTNILDAASNNKVPQMQSQIFYFQTGKV